jgi:hypothetical protein
MVNVDMTINLGHVLTLIGVLITFVTWGQNIKFTLTHIDRRVGEIEKNLHELSRLQLADAVINTQMVMVHDRLAVIERRFEHAKSLEKSSRG